MPGVCAIGGCGGGEGECATFGVAICEDYVDLAYECFPDSPNAGVGGMMMVLENCLYSRASRGRQRSNQID